MKYTALIGRPTDHSVSHIMYAELAKASGYSSFYQHIRVDIEPDRLKPAIGAFGEIGFAGLNVTLPYKLEIISHLDKLDDAIEKVGAVNTITLGEVTTGYNTDWVGIVEPVKRFSGKAAFKKAVIFGTGGAARAAIYACSQLGIEAITVIYRQAESPATRELMSKRELFGIEMAKYADVAAQIAEADLIINTTSAGMVGKDPLPFDLDLIRDVPVEGKVFLDAVFNPLATPLLKHFKAAGATTIDGLWMMMYQGMAALSLWLDTPISADDNELERIHTMLEQEISHV